MSFDSRLGLLVFYPSLFYTGNPWQADRIAISELLFPVAGTCGPWSWRSIVPLRRSLPPESPCPLSCCAPRCLWDRCPPALSAARFKMVPIESGRSRCEERRPCLSTPRKTAPSVITAAWRIAGAICV
jgi:hypothetical protein